MRLIITCLFTCLIFPVMLQAQFMPLQMQHFNIKPRHIGVQLGVGKSNNFSIQYGVRNRLATFVNVAYFNIKYKNTDLLSSAINTINHKNKGVGVGVTYALIANAKSKLELSGMVAYSDVLIKKSRFITNTEMDATLISPVLDMHYVHLRHKTNHYVTLRTVLNYYKRQLEYLPASFLTIKGNKERIMSLGLGYGFVYKLNRVKLGFQSSLLVPLSGFEHSYTDTSGSIFSSKLQYYLLPNMLLHIGYDL
jgi:hypothetical protein